MKEGNVAMDGHGRSNHTYHSTLMNVNTERDSTARGFQAKLDTHRVLGKPAMHEHKCEYCGKLRCDHVKTPASWTCLATQARKLYKISSRGFSKFVWPGGPPTDRRNRRAFFQRQTLIQILILSLASKWATGLTSPKLPKSSSSTFR